MKTPDQLEKRLKKYFKVDLSDKETNEKLEKIDEFIKFKFKLLHKVNCIISMELMSAKEKGYEKGLGLKFLTRELSEVFSIKDDFYKAQNKLKRLRDIVCKAQHSEDLSLIEYNWIKKELKKF